jgi:membrane-associated phospholipid phosphatase
MEKPKNLNSALLLPGAFLMAAAALFIFGWLAEEMLEGDTQRFDSLVRATVHQHATPGLTRLMMGFSFLGSAATVSVLGVVLLSAFLYFRQVRLAALLGITMIGMAALDFVLKLAFHRPRPVAFFGPSPSSYSFPSGHSFGALCFYGVLAGIFAARVHGKAAKSFIWIVAAVLIAMIGLSRIYLGVHYPSDVIAGYCAGAVWVTAVGLLDKILTGRRKEMDEGKTSSNRAGMSSGGWN